MKLLATLVASTYAAAGTDYSGKLDILEIRMRFHRETFRLSFYFFRPSFGTHLEDTLKVIFIVCNHPYWLYARNINQR